MNGWLFLAITALMSAGAFLNGRRFARIKTNPFVGRKIFSMPIEGSGLPILKLNLIGRIQMFAAPIFLLLIIALVFGLFGPVEGIQTIQI